MKVMIVKELMTGDVSPVAMFSLKSFFFENFLAVQNSSIGDLVTDSLTH